MVTFADNAIRTGILVVGYVILAGAGLELAFVHGTISPVWPAAGFAVGALTLWGLNQWPAIAIGALLANFLLADNPLAVAVAIAAGNTLEACLGAMVLRRFNVAGEVSCIRDGLVIVGVALVAPAPSTISGVASLSLDQFLPLNHVLPAGIVWWVGNAMGHLIALPLMLAWFGRAASQEHAVRRSEFVAVLLLTVGIISLLFLNSKSLLRIGLASSPVAAALFPTVLWAILRFRPREALVVLAVGFTLAILFTASRTGSEMIGPLLGLQAMMFSISSATLVMLGAITDRIRTQSALARSEQKLSDTLNTLNVILESAPTGIAYVSLPDRRFLWVNERLCAILGYAREELLRKTALDITLPDDASIGQTDYKRLEACRIDNFKMEKRYVRKDGGVIWARTWTASVCNVEHTHAAFAIGIIEDVTQARLVEEARYDAERRLKLAVDTAQLGLWELDVASEQLLVAPEWESRLDLKASGVVETKNQWLERIHPDDADRVSQYLRSYLAGPAEHYEIEYRFRFGDGTYRWLSSRAVPVTDQSGRLTKLIGTHLDITERKRTEQRIREESLHDPLTGLPSRALILEHGHHLLGVARRKHSRCAVLYVDLDRFKPINDTYGHEAGDSVLKEVARRLRACTRQEDMVGRIGGDEFVIVLPHADEEHHRVESVVRHVLDTVSRPIALDSTKVSVSPSIGVSAYPEQGTDMEMLLQKADMAMYQVKQKGRASYQAYTSDMERRADDLSASKSRLSAALNTGNLTLYYQPIMDLCSGRMVAVEALLRVVQEDGSVTGPASILPGTGSPQLSARLDQWVLMSACRQYEKWSKEGIAPITLSINVSPTQLADVEFTNKVQEIVAERGINPSCLQLELPGRSIDLESIGETVGHLKAFGFKVALDSIDSDTLSLTHLSRLSIDRIKMELTFDKSPAVETLARLIVAVGHVLKLAIVGEGVESKGALDTALATGCDEVQGFYLGCPLPPADFARWYQSHSEVH